MKATVLVVDDELLLREVIKDYLDKNDYNVFEAANGRKALEIIKSQIIDFAFIDIKMPGMSGLVLIEKLKEIAPNLKVAIITAFPSLETVDKADSLGVCEYLVKPFKIEIVKEVLEKYLKTAQKEKITIAEKVEEKTDRKTVNHLINRRFSASAKFGSSRNIQFYFKESKYYKKKKLENDVKKLDLLVNNEDFTLEELNKKRKLLKRKNEKK